MDLRTLFIEKSGKDNLYQAVQYLKDYLGVAPATLNNWVYGRNRPKLDLFRLREMLNRLEVSFEEFCDAVEKSHS